MLLVLQSASPAGAQTTLFPGDVAVVGVATNVGDDDLSSYCETGTGTGRDRVSIVFFKDVEPGTSLDLTDNGWERSLPGKWGNSEGFLNIVRTGAVIPAGTTVTFEFSRTGGPAPIAILPDGDWAFIQLGTRYLNLGSGGDQLFLLQDGVWYNGTGCPPGSSCNNDATYTGGRLLFGYSTNGWITTPPGSANNVRYSRLPPSLNPCFNVSLPGNFNSYQAPTSAATQPNWLVRIRSLANWGLYGNCLTYQEPPEAFPLLTPAVYLECIGNCSGCAPLHSTLRLTIGLPANWGPFTVVYNDGSTNVTINNATNGQIISVTNTVSRLYKIISITAANGCPLIYSFGPDVPVTVFPKPEFQNYNMQVCAGSMVDLSALNYNGDNTAGATVTFHSSLPPGPSNQLPNPVVTVNNTVTYYGLAISPDGCLDTFPIALTALAAPNAGTAQNSQFCRAAPGAPTLFLPNYLTGENPGGQWSLAPGSDDPGALFNAGAGTLDLNGLVPGNYAFVYTVTTAQCGSDDETLSIIINDIPQVTVETTEAACNGGSGGSLTVLPTAGLPPFLFNAGGGFQSSNTFVNLPAGAYTVTVADANGCTTTGTGTVQQSPAISLSCGQISPATPAGNDGVGSINFGGGVPGYVIAWSGPQSGSQSGAVPGTVQLVNLPAGAYTVTVTDSNNCTATCSFSIDQLPCMMTATADLIQGVQCFGGSDGSISVSVSGTTLSPYFDWNINAYDGLQNLTGVPAGVYTVTVTAGVNCLAVASVIVTGPDAIALQPALVQVSCPGGSDGSIALQVTGGTPGYLYAWDPSAYTGQSIAANLTAGIYAVTVTDMQGCTQSGSFQILDGQPLLLDCSQLNPVSIAGGNDGTGQIVINGNAFFPMQVQWSGPASGNQSTLAASTNLNNLPAGNYSVTVTNSLNCTEVCSFSIEEPDCSTPDSTYLNFATCDPALAGVTVQSLTAANGCDSIVVTTTVLFLPDTVYLSATTCDPAQVGISLLTLTNANGCDSTVITTTNLLLPDTVYLNATTCDPAHRSASPCKTGAT